MKKNNAAYTIFFPNDPVYAGCSLFSSAVIQQNDYDLLPLNLTATILLNF